MEIKDQELLPCPFCGSVKVAKVPVANIGYAVSCNGCGASSEVGPSDDAAIKKWNRRAHLAQPAQAVDVAMVERALTYRARNEDGAAWPDAYGAEEQSAEREQMRAMLSEALNPNGPKAYCRACQRAGMSNCGYFDECTGATCVTCHRPFVDARALSGEKAGPVGDGWTRAEAKLSERKTVHVWLNDLHIEREESGRPLCLLRRLSILRDRYYEACKQLSHEARKPEGWINVDLSRPERNEPAIYWHKSEFGGFAAIADEWRDEHHLASASHWMPYTPPASPAPDKEGK